ncbi:hypothetical protein LJY25_08595 [Hymenobacter sp. BT175]|uniref:hypothetical protein n=1 Tax=Hymenobacter translucens TaxID=2886507 RepID=UPI001D0EFE61|nr:hypothetical protein [Hymenobacter translucens]MCC2546499.1 hypothetical protein [Hymenobacter translucens]
MKELLVALSLLSSHSIVAQRAIHVEVRPGQAENFWRTHVLSREDELELNDVAAGSQPFYLRLWKGEAIIDIWPKQSGYQGSLTQWVKERVPSGEEETGRYFIIKEAVDSAACRQLYLAYLSRQLDALPSEEKISGWKEGFDGVTYILETLKNDTYYLKSYWTPSIQEGVKEAGLVQGFVADVDQLLDLKRRSYYFNKSIPFESWTTSGGASVSRILTLAGHFTMKKERNRYRWLIRKQANHSK